MKQVNISEIKCSVCDKKRKSISAIIEETKKQMCDQYCKYPTLPIPEGKSDDWLIEDDDSPCMECPLNEL